MRTTTQQSMIIELTHPVSSWIRTAVIAVQDYITQKQVNRMKRQVLSRKFEALTDPTFLDRVEAGESAQ